MPIPVNPLVSSPPNPGMGYASPRQVSIVGLRLSAMKRSPRGFNSPQIEIGETKDEGDNEKETISYYHSTKGVKQ
jgi:hypothetical protein